LFILELVSLCLVMSCGDVGLAGFITMVISVKHPNVES
jgi:hypothetical protein